MLGFLKVLGALIELAIVLYEVLGGSMMDNWPFDW